MQPRFEIVVSIEESKDNENMSLEELQGSLEAHELRTNERSLKRSSNEALRLKDLERSLGQKQVKKRENKTQQEWLVFKPRKVKR